MYTLFDRFAISELLFFNVRSELPTITVRSSSNFESHLLPLLLVVRRTVADHWNIFKAFVGSEHIPQILHRFIFEFGGVSILVHENIQLVVRTIH